MKSRETTPRAAMGAQCGAKGTVFRVWAPGADGVTLLLSGGAEDRRVEMRRENGAFVCRVKGSLDGTEYAFGITRGGRTEICPDVCARAVSADGTRSVCADMKRRAPEGWADDRTIAFSDPERAVICELSVRDVSMDKSADFSARGKFAALCGENVRNSCGDAVGLPYIKSLGATHIQLMPVFDFDLDGGEYNWGYNPRFHSAPSAYYAQTDGVRELRELVAAAHRAGLGVIFDVVYNHVYDAEKSGFERIFPGYYFRKKPVTGGFSNGSGCGNEFASERAMARRYIVDSLVFIAREYHADGFRFDLMGLLDLRTLRAAERRLRAVNPDILLYGEGWTGGASPLPENRRAVLSSARRLPGFAFFNDALRDALKGSVFSTEDRGYVNGAPDEYRYERIKVALSGEYPADFWTDTPRQSINYAECHDNLTLFDKLSATLGGDIERIRQAEKMTAALLFLSPGITFFQLGQEFMRSKNGSGNSYALPDRINSVKWDRLPQERDTADYYAGMAAFRSRFLGKFGRRTFKRLGGGFMMTAGEFVLLVSPTAETLSPDISGRFEVYADESRASASPLRVADKLSCKPFSVLLAKKVKSGEWRVESEELRVESGE